MEKAFITDTDFLSNEYNGDLYQLIYGIFYHKTEDDIYNMLVKLVQEQKSVVLKRAKLKLWKSELETIIERLKKYIRKTNEVWVIIPVYLFELRLIQTISIFQFAANIIDELLKDDCEPVFLGNDDFPYPLGSLKDFFFEFLVIVHTKEYTEGYFKVSQDAIQDEMIRRGIGGNLEKSEHYEEELFRKFFVTKEVIGTESEPVLTENHPLEKISAKEMTTVLYYMLCDKVDDETIIKVANYVIGKPYNEKVRKANNNSISKYVRYNSKKLEDINSDVVMRVFKVLNDYEFEISERLKQYVAKYCK